MRTVLKSMIAGLMATALLVGCSLLSQQRRVEAGDALDIREPLPLKPGLADVTVGDLGASAAVITWRSGWQGQSIVSYGLKPAMPPVVMERSAPTPARTVSLTGLKPKTRYYFQVETLTAIGVARSAVLSFRTR